MSNPFEPIGVEPPEKGAPPSFPKGYRCPKCREVFLLDNYVSREVYYGVNLVKCDCCTRYSETSVNEDNFEWAWDCGNGCFNHDIGQSPEIANRQMMKVEVGWICAKWELHLTEISAKYC